MTLKIGILAVIFSLGLLIFILFLIRTKRLSVKYSILWLATCIVIMGLSCSPYILNSIAPIIGIQYPPSLLFLATFLFLLIIVLHFSVVISTIFDTMKGLIQKVSIMNYKLEELEKKINSLSK